jgi:hypothetical protein
MKPQPIIQPVIFFLMCRRLCMWHDFYSGTQQEFWSFLSSSVWSFEILSKLISLQSQNLPWNTFHFVNSLYEIYVFRCNSRRQNRRDLRIYPVKVSDVASYVIFQWPNCHVPSMIIVPEQVNPSSGIQWKKVSVQLQFIKIEKMQSLVGMKYLVVYHIPQLEINNGMNGWMSFVYVVWTSENEPKSVVCNISKPAQYTQQFYRSY